MKNRGRFTSINVITQHYPETTRHPQQASKQSDEHEGGEPSEFCVCTTVPKTLGQKFRLGIGLISGLASLVRYARLVAVNHLMREKETAHAYMFI